MLLIGEVNTHSEVETIPQKTENSINTPITLNESPIILISNIVHEHENSSGHIFSAVTPCCVRWITIVDWKYFWHTDPYLWNRKTVIARPQGIGGMKIRAVSTVKRKSAVTLQVLYKHWCVGLRTSVDKTKSTTQMG